MPFKNPEDAKAYRRAYYLKNKAKIDAYDRKRYNLPERKKQFKKAQANYSETISGRATMMFKGSRIRALKKGISFNLTKKWIEERLNKGECEITGICFDFKPSKLRNRNPYAPSIERLDSDKGYVKANCKIVVWGFNCAKGEMSMEEFKIFLTELWEGMTR